MKLLSFVLALGLAHGAFSSVLERNACEADNCARAVTGTRPGKLPVVSVRRADCSSFMLITVTPATKTITKTHTTTVLTTLPVLAKREDIAARQVTVSPSVVPTYASACKGPSRYSSACSCWGITQHYTTAPTPVATITKTVTVTVPVCPPGDHKCGGACYNLKTSNHNCGSCGHKCTGDTTCQGGTCKLPPGRCSNPTVCSGNDSCGKGECFCHPDSSGQGYCHPAAPCNFPLCKTNKDCKSGSVCVSNCCGNVCRPIQPVCNNPAIKSRIFQKRDGDWSDPVVEKRDEGWSDPSAE